MSCRTSDAFRVVPGLQKAHLPPTIPHQGCKGVQLVLPRGGLAETGRQAIIPDKKLEFHSGNAQAYLSEAGEAASKGVIFKTMGDSYGPSRRSSHLLTLGARCLHGAGVLE